MADQEELDQLAEAEYSRLQRQSRQLQCELKTLQEDKIHHLKKQEKLISLLQQEHHQLKSDIDFLLNGVHAKKETEQEKKLSYLMSQFDDMQNILQQEKTNLWELESHIKKIQKEIDALRNNEIPDNRYKETIAKIREDVVKLENRLDIVNKKCSDVLTENSKLRESIDHILQDRAHFNDLWKSMVAQFNEGKKYIMDLIDQSTIAFDQREELCNKLQILKDRNEADKLLHVQEMRELQRKLEHDAKLQEFYNVKGQRRTNIELEAREANKKLQQKEELEKQLEEYNNILVKIQELTKQDDISNLPNQYNTQEEENFALFNYVNELSHEVEVLNENVRKIEDEIEKQKEDQAGNEFRKETETVEYLENEKVTITLKANEAINVKKIQDQRLLLLLQGIEMIFRLIRCNDAPILNILGTKNFLTIDNVQLYLVVIYKRINKIISNANLDDNQTKILAKKDRVPKFNIKVNVQLKN